MLRAAVEAVGLDGEATMQRSQELRGAVQDRYEERWRSDGGAMAAMGVSIVMECYGMLYQVTQ